MTKLPEIRLLLAEDEWLIVDRIERALAGSRYIIAAKTPSLDVALRLLDTIRFDAAVLDGNLDGDRTSALAQRLHAAGTPFLMLTAYSGAVRALTPCQAPVLAKPFARSALLAALNLLINAHSCFE